MQRVLLASVSIWICFRFQQLGNIILTCSEELHPLSASCHKAIYCISCRWQTLSYIRITQGTRLCRKLDNIFTVSLYLHATVSNRVSPVPIFWKNYFLSITIVEIQYTMSMCVQGLMLLREDRMCCESTTFGCFSQTLDGNILNMRIHCCVCHLIPVVAIATLKPECCRN